MGLTVTTPTQSLTPTSSSISLDEKYVARPCDQEDAIKDMAKRNLRYRRANGTYYTRGPRYTLVLLGGEGVGKTTLSYQFMFHKTDSTSYYPRKNPPALYQKPFQVDGTTYLIDVVDTNTKPEVQNEYLRKASAIMLVYSITSKSSFQAVKQILNDCLRTESISCQGFPTSSAAQMTYHPMILVGNIRDKSTEREVSEQDGLELARNIGCKFIELSAKNTDDVMKAFNQMVKDLDEAVVDMEVVDMEVVDMGTDKHYDACQVLKSWSGFLRSCFGRRAR